MVKRRKLTAAAVVYAMGLAPPAKTPDGKDIRYGLKAIVGQYVKPYTRTVELREGRRNSKGQVARHKQNHGTEGRLDLSEVINARR